jgi:class 3 adenylate cyclase/tetratricopeptide (TPR) repeat protein
VTDTAVPVGHGRRKIVTVLFCDVTGSTAIGESIDPEALQSLLARYFERMSAIIERHGGSVEKFIGDAVMAVFGIPQAHEDDALRACRAALAMIAALPDLGVQARIGISTGEVMTGTPERLATGDAVNVAARLEQAAEPGTVLISAATHAYASGALDVAHVEPLRLKGKAEPVAALELRGVHEIPERRRTATFVGREAELELLRNAFDRALSEQRCVLVSVTGDPGVGKSRLIEEFLDTATMRVVRGRCLAYGEGITYWPVVEIIKQLDTEPDDPAAATAIRTLLREADEPTTPDEIAWAFRKLVEQSAPLVCVFDDLQWAHDSLLDLVDEVAMLSATAPILLLCLARPELSERRSEWQVDIRLKPLSPADATTLLSQDLPGELRDRVIHAAGGNPLFLTEMAALALETPAVGVPPDLQALLTARLDQLEEPVRAVLERGAIEGEVFHRGAVQALAVEAQVTPRLTALVRKQLIRPDRSAIPREDAYRFLHLLVRDAAYAALPKATRAQLHERFADWLMEHADELVERDEIVGYHLEQAWSYRNELGHRDDRTRQLAARAGSLLTRAGRRALIRGDADAATSLLRRAVALRSDGASDPSLRIDLVDALWDAGRLDDAAAEAADAAASAAEAGDAVGAARLRIRLAHAYLESQHNFSFEEFERVLDEAMPIITGSDDDAALGTLWYYKGLFASNVGQLKAGRDALVRAAEYERAAGDWRAKATALRVVAFREAIPVDEALADVEHNLAGNPGWLAGLDTKAELLALSGQFEEAKQIYEAATARWAERSHPLRLATRAQLGWGMAMAAGDLVAAEAVARDGCERLKALGERAYLSTQACELALTLCMLGRCDESTEWVDLGESLGDPDDDVTQALVWQVRAELAIRAGDARGARELADRAVTISERMDLPVRAGRAVMTCARAAAAAGDTAAAARHVDRAIALFESVHATAYVDMARRERVELTA